MTVSQQGFAMHVHIIYHTCTSIYGNGHALCCHFVACQHTVHLNYACRCKFCVLLSDGLGSIGILQRQLLMCYHITGRQHCIVVFQNKFNIKHYILCRILCQNLLYYITLYPHWSGFLLRKHHLVQCRLICFLSINQNAHRHTYVIRTCKELLVVDRERTLFQVDVLYPVVLIAILHLVGMRMERTVWSNNAIAVEIVVRGRIAAGVTAIHPYLVAGNLTLAAHGLIHHVPDESALI